ncbi:hypothetical protein B7R74_02590 [Yersinia pseudotuberculosis]|nr:hypothetical protein B7R74_02590 [Yersinia pseudotuberculosis]
METRCKLRYLHLDRCACHTELSIFRYASACAFTTFGWVLPRPDLGGWQDSGSFSTHANVKPVTVPASIPTMYRPHII